MTLLIGAVGWSLFAVGALVHLAHHRRFRDLVSLHFRYPGQVAAAIVIVEITIAILIPLAFAADLSILLTAASVAATLLGTAFAIWVARLLLGGSEMPCACSYSAEPASKLSLARSLATLPVLAFAFADHSGAAADTATITAAAALGIAIFTLPDALQWSTDSARLRQELST